MCDINPNIRTMPKSPAKAPIIYKSGFPLSLYLFLSFPIVSSGIFVFYQLSILALLINLPVAMLLFYTFFCRHSSKIEITAKNEMRITYFFPWDKNVLINLTKFKYIDYARGFYNPFDERTLGYSSLFRKCYDLLIVSDNINDSQIEIKVNTKLLNFHKLIRFLKKDNKLFLIKLKNTKAFIW